MSLRRAHDHFYHLAVDNDRGSKASASHGSGHSVKVGRVWRAGVAHWNPAIQSFHVSPESSRVIFSHDFSPEGVSIHWWVFGESLGQVDHSRPGPVNGSGDQTNFGNTKILNTPEWSLCPLHNHSISTVKAWVPNRAIWRKVALAMRKEMLQTLHARQARSNLIIDLESLHDLVFKLDAIQIAFLWSHKIFC